MGKALVRVQGQLRVSGSWVSFGRRCSVASQSNLLQA